MIKPELITAMFNAARNNKFTKLETLLQQAITETGWEKLEFIQDPGNGKHLLTHIIQFNATECLELLLKYGADIHYIDDRLGQSLLFFAIKNQKPQAAALLVKHGADTMGALLELAGKEFKTAKKYFKILLHAGARFEFSDFESERDLTIQNYETDYGEELDFSVPEMLLTQRLFMQAKTLEDIKRGLNIGLSPDFIMYAGWGPAIVNSIIYGNKEGFHHLIYKRADLTVTGSFKFNALMAASWAGAADIASTICEMAPELIMKENSGGKSALMIASKYPEIYDTLIGSIPEEAP